MQAWEEESLEADDKSCNWTTPWAVLSLLRSMLTQEPRHYAKKLGTFSTFNIVIHLSRFKESSFCPMLMLYTHKGAKMSQSSMIVSYFYQIQKVKGQDTCRHQAMRMNEKIATVK